MKIKKVIILAAVCGLIASLFSGCAEPVNEAIGEYSTELSGGIVSDIISDVMSDIDGYEDGTTTKRQQIQIYSAEDSSLLYTITDNNAISAYMQNAIGAIAGLKYLSAIPSDAEALYVYILQQEDLDSELPVDERPLLETLRNILYKNDSGYYMAVQFDDETWYVSLQNATSEYLINLAKGKVESDMTVTESDDTLDEYDDVYDDFDYEGIAGVSKNQKIEVLSLENNNIILSITNIEEIVVLLQNQRATDWERIDSIPADAQEVRALVRYAEQRKTADKQLAEQYRDILYANSDGYYIENIIADNNLNPSLDELESECFKIPNDVGEYLINLK